MALYIAYGNEQRIETSPDGVTWTQKFFVAATADGFAVINDIAFDNVQTYVAVGAYKNVTGHPVHPGVIISSIDGGVTWTNRALGGSPQLAYFLQDTVVWANTLGLWCAVGSDFGTGQALSLTSPDGVTWTPHNFATETSFGAIATNGSIFVATNQVSGVASKIYSSTDGATWTLRATLSQALYQNITWNGSYFMAAMAANRVPWTPTNATSPDGITWTEGTPGNGANVTVQGGVGGVQPSTTRILFDTTLNLWVIPSVYTTDGLSSGIFTSADGRTWTKRYTASTDGSSLVSAIVRAGAKLYAILTGTPYFISSVDAITWTAVGTSLVDPSFMLEWTGSNFITYSIPAFGDNFIRTSPNGINWTNVYDDALLDIQFVKGFSVVTPPPPAPPGKLPIVSQGPSRGIVLNLDRQVFEPLQSFSEIIWSITQEQNAQGARWLDLPNPWSTYGATWNSFPSKNQRAIMLGTQGANGVTWQDLPNPWNTYNVPWNSFPGGGQVEIFSANSPNDHGVAIPYFYVPALFFGNDRQTVLLDSWDFYFLASQNFELATVEFSGLTMPKAAAVPITDSLVDLSDDRTYAIAKALPIQSKYNRYVKLRLSGSSFYRAFRFGGGTVFLYSQERPSA